MPSLPVDNCSINSHEDAYRRYFGALKSSSPAKARTLLCCDALMKICIYSLLASIPNFIMLYFYYRHEDNIYNKYHLYYIYNVTQMLITFIWCLSVIYVIFKHKYANMRIMTFNAFIISLFSLSISTYLSYLYHEHNIGSINIKYDLFLYHEYWRLDMFYFLIFRFPLTLWFSIVIMYFSQYCCLYCCTFAVTSSAGTVNNIRGFSQRLIEVPDNMYQTDVEVFEYMTNTTGTTYGDNEVELSINNRRYSAYSINDQVSHHPSVSTVSLQDLEKIIRKVVTIHMSVYCLVFVFVLSCWFLIITANPEKYGKLRIVLFGGLICTYYIGKWILKKMARQIDTAIIIPNFSFEIITEILMSSFYWCNFRMFTLRYHWDGHSYWSFPVIAFIHIFSEIFQDSIRMSFWYFNFTGKYMKGKSNIIQWKVRGAIDTTIRFIIVIYSIIFVTIRYPPLELPKILTSKNIINSAFFNYSVFIVELIYFCCMLFRPGCLYAGQISEQQQINMTEPLMRMYNKNKNLFLMVFCGSMVMASLLVI